VPSIHDPDFEPASEREGFRSRRARLGRQAASEHLGASLYELAPGQAAWPYHAHLANEELLVVVGGRPSLRTPEGWRELAEGEVVAFVRGERGAHQVVNRGESPARILIVSEMNAPEVTLYPDSGKVGAFGRPPGSPGEGLEVAIRTEDAVDYWDGEKPPNTQDP
jgi:uncharacterized cupin superfamily protein